MMVAGSLDNAALHRWLPWFMLFLGLFVFSPFVFLRYEFHDSWAWLYWINGSRLIEGANPCLQLGSGLNLIGRPLMTPILCAMTVFGAEIDLVWIPKLFALLLLFGSGAMIFAVFRSVGAGAVGALALGSALFLPGFVLMIVMMVANAIAWAAFAAVLAGFLWWKLALGAERGFAAKGAMLLAILVLLVAALATYQIVATLFFVPLLTAIVFSEAKAGGAAMLRAAAGAALLFLVAAITFLVAHRILLLDYGYFFMPVEQVRGAAVAERTVATITSFADVWAKLAFLGQLMPRLLSLWFISEHYPVHPVMPWVFGAATLAFLALFAVRAANIWRVLALLLVTACFFGPFAVSHNSGNGLYQLERVKVFMQVPFVLFLWALVQRLFARRSCLLPAAGSALAIAMAVGPVVTWLTVMRARVMPTYMELKRAEPRLREAVRRDIKRIYIVKTEDNHLRATIGVPGGDEFGRVTSFYFPHQMVYAILLEIERRGTARAVVDIDADKAHTIPAGGPEKLVLDMRKFP